MNKYIVILIAFVGLSIFACNRKNSTATTAVPKLGDTITVVMDTPLTIKDQGLKITFNKLEDSRCPKYTNCIQAGEAKASILFERPGLKQTVVFEAKGNCEDMSAKCGEQKRAIGYEVQLLNVYPYPEEGPKKEDAPKANAKLIVNKMDY